MNSFKVNSAKSFIRKQCPLHQKFKGHIDDIPDQYQCQPVASESLDYT